MMMMTTTTTRVDLLVTLVLFLLCSVSKWIYPSTACTNLFTCLSRVLHSYPVDGCFSPAVIRTLGFPPGFPFPFSTLIYTLISCVRRRPVSSTLVFFYLNHNDMLTRLFLFCVFFLTLFFVFQQILAACNFNSPSDLSGVVIVGS